MCKWSFFLIIFLVHVHAVSAMDTPQLECPTPKSSVLKWILSAFIPDKSEEIPSKLRMSEESVETQIALMESDQPPVRLQIHDEDKNIEQQQAQEYARAICARLYYNYPGGRPVTPPGESQQELKTPGAHTLSLECFSHGSCCP